MKDAATLLALADKVAALTGPDREVDAEIADAIHWDDPIVHEDDARLMPFTVFIDAAVMLVPEGWGWLVSQPNAKAIASGLLKRDTPVRGEVQNGIDRRFTVAAATPALALTEAALKARASLSDTQTETM